MRLGLGFSAFQRSRSSKRIERSTAPSRCFRPTLETLEGRLVLSAAAPLAPSLGTALVGHHHPGHHVLAPIQMAPLSINSLAVQGGQLVANGSLGSTPF